jgi:dihydroorotate dehydrogenase electron transfer subunit
VELVRVIEKKLIKDYFVLVVETKEPFNSQPGQFFMINFLDTPNLPKPFSVMDEKGIYLTFLIKIVGPFTEKLSTIKYGDFLFIRGPYGVPIINKIDLTKKYILLGGGCGSAPLIYFSKEYPMLVKYTLFSFKEVYIQSILPNFPLFIDDVMGITPIEFLSQNKEQLVDLGTILCGSKGLLKSFFDTFPNMKNRSYVSLEENMGCGAGLCKGCPIQTVDGVKMVCKDGPIFKANEVNLEWK